MIDKNIILKTIFQKTNLSVNNKGRIINIEKRIGIDLDGDNLIGDVHDSKKNDPDNLIHEIVETFNELSTIINVDREILKRTIEETKNVGRQPGTKTNDAAEAIVKKPAKVYRPNKF
jgi:hypothetical protein